MYKLDTYIKHIRKMHTGEPIAWGLNQSMGFWAKGGEVHGDHHKEDAAEGNELEGGSGTPPGRF